MNAKILLSIIIFSLFAALALMLMRSEPAVPEGYSRLPVTTDNEQVEVSQNQTITLQRGDNVIEILDVRTQPETVQISDSQYALYGYDFERKYPFAATFNENDGSIAVALLAEPLAETRLAAEKSLQERLGVTAEEMCLLAIYVGVPVSINAYFSDRNLGISYCPGAVPL